MDFEQILSVSCIGLNEDVHDSRGVLARIAGLACTSPAIGGLPASWVFESLSAREDLGSTALENGVALPHCRLQGATGFAGGILTTSREVDFGGGITGEPGYSPSSWERRKGRGTPPPSAFLAGFLRREENRKAILSASSPDQIPALLAAYRERASLEGLPE